VAVVPFKAYYSQGDQVMLTATARGATNQFAGWSGDFVGTTNPLLLTLDTSKVITASFVAGLPAVRTEWTAGLVPGLSLNLTGLPGQAYVLQSATNLGAMAQWQSVLTNTADTNGVWQFTETNFNSAQKYYRIITP
jgi:hypothetical protein